MLLFGFYLITGITGIYENRFTRQSSLPEVYVLWQVAHVSSIECAALCSRDRRCHSFTTTAENQICIAHSATAGPMGLFPRYMAEDNPGAITMLMSAKHCKNDWASLENSCYLFSKDSAAWEDAENKCIEVGGHLVEIGSQMEQEFVGNLVMAKGRCFWTGGKYNWTNRRWYWSFSRELMIFTNWYPGEPYDTEGRVHENVAFANCWSHSTEWDNAHKADHNYYICEYIDLINNSCC